ncbi:MAG: endonuclease [Bacteroidales bacterium]|nr:endonuclease [Bacteroidales bacterium]
MRREIVVIAILLLCAAPESSAQVVFWNVENYFDTRNEADKEDDDFTPGGDYHWNKKRYLAKRNFIAKALIATADSLGALPAAIALAEVENRRVLDDLVDGTPLAKTGYRIVHRDSPDARGIDVALLYDPARLTLLSCEFLTVEGFLTREILYCRLAAAADSTLAPLHLFVNHWPSKRGGAASSDSRRIAVSQLLSGRIAALLAEDPAARILLVGDFNDTPDSEALRALCEDCGLHNIALPLWRQGKGSIRYKGKWELIDQAVVSGQLADEGASFSIFDASFLQEYDSAFLGLKPKRTFVGPRYNGGVSDHLPVLIRLLFKEMQ